jgi:hypothetical protein
MRGFYEFFAGGGMVRAGLGAEWKCLFSNFPIELAGPPSSPRGKLRGIESGYHNIS